MTIISGQDAARSLVSKGRGPVSAQVDSLLDWEYATTSAELGALQDRARTHAWSIDDLDWSAPVNLEQRVRDIAYPLSPGAYYNALLQPPHMLDDDEAVMLATHILAFMLSQFLHGEQGAMLACAKLVQVLPTVEGKLAASAQLTDEARHVEVYSRYLTSKLEIAYPVHPSLDQLLRDILEAAPWDFTVLGMQIIVEGLALAAFNLMHAVAPDEPLISEITRLVSRDEARHVAFGVLLLGKGYVAQMTPVEVKAREEFVVHSVHQIHERLLMSPVLARLGWTQPVWSRWLTENTFMRGFRQLLLGRLVPTVRVLGLWTPQVQSALRAHGYTDVSSKLPAGEGWLPKEVLRDLRPFLLARRAARSTKKPVV